MVRLDSVGGGSSVVNPASCYDPGEGAFVCPGGCQRCFPCAVSLSSHLKKDHLFQFPLECRHCGVGAADPAWLSKHEALCANWTQSAPVKEERKCPTDEEADVKANVNAEHTDEVAEAVEEFLCNLCSRNFASGPGLRLHQVRSHGLTPKKRKFEAISQERRLSDRNVVKRVPTSPDKGGDYVEETKDEGMSDSQHHCGMCPKVFGSGRALSTHEQRAHGLKPKSKLEMPLPEYPACGDVDQPADENTRENEEEINCSVEFLVIAGDVNDGAPAGSLGRGTSAGAPPTPQKEVKVVSGLSKCSICGMCFMAPFLLARHADQKHGNKVKTKSPRKGLSTPTKSPRKGLLTPTKSPRNGLSTPKKSPWRNAEPHRTPKQAFLSPQASSSSSAKVEVIERKAAPVSSPFRTPASVSSEAAGSSDEFFRSAVRRLSSGKFECALCDMSCSANRSLIILHIQKAHSSEGKFKCPSCSCAFANERGLRIHFGRHGAKSNRAPPLSDEQWKAKFNIVECRVVLEVPAPELYKRKTKDVASNIGIRTLFQCRLCKKRRNFSEVGLKLHMLWKHSDFDRKKASGGKERKPMEKEYEPAPSDGSVLTENMPKSSELGKPEPKPKCEVGQESDAKQPEEKMMEPQKMKKRKKKNREAKPWVTCFDCGIRILGNSGAADHIVECRSAQLEKAREDHRVIVLADKPYDVFESFRERKEGFQCVDCQLCFPTYRKFCLHAGTVVRYPNPLTQFIARV